MTCQRSASGAIEQPVFSNVNVRWALRFAMLLVVAGVFFVQRSRHQEVLPTPAQQVQLPPVATQVRPKAPADAPIAAAQDSREEDGLPKEALEVVEAIIAGGPFQYERDGIEFRNFERRLPAQHRGYYREFTVATPGVKHRGKRRLVAGQTGELYYTDDHYAHFRRLKTRWKN